MYIRNSLQHVAAITAEARHIVGTAGQFSTIDLTIVGSDGQEVGFDLFVAHGPHAAKIADIYARAITAAALEAAALSAIPVETVEEAA